MRACHGPRVTGRVSRLAGPEASAAVAPCGRGARGGEGRALREACAARAAAAHSRASPPAVSEPVRTCVTGACVTGTCVTGTCGSKRIAASAAADQRERAGSLPPSLPASLCGRLCRRGGVHGHGQGRLRLVRVARHRLPRAACRVPPYGRIATARALSGLYPVPGAAPVPGARARPRPARHAPPSRRPRDAARRQMS